MTQYGRLWSQAQIQYSHKVIKLCTSQHKQSYVVLTRFFFFQNGLKYQTFLLIVRFQKNIVKELGKKIHENYIVWIFREQVYEETWTRFFNH